MGQRARNSLYAHRSFLPRRSQFGTTATDYTTQSPTPTVPDCFCDLIPVHLGHAQVQDHDIKLGLVRAHALDGALAVVEARHCSVYRGVEYV